MPSDSRSITFGGKISVSVGITRQFNLSSNALILDLTTVLVENLTCERVSPIPLIGIFTVFLGNFSLLQQSSEIKFDYDPASKTTLHE